MFKGNKYYYMVFFALLFLGFLSILIFIIIEVMKKSPKCYNPTILATDELQIGNNTFSKQEFEKINETHFGICLENQISVLQKCCDENQILSMKGKRISCDMDENLFETGLVIHDENNEALPNYNLSNFYRRYGMISCPNKKYFLNSKYEEDSFFFRQDGTLYIPGENTNKTHNSDQFCLDMTKDEMGSYLGALVCFPEKEDKQQQLKLYPYGMIISTPFLFAIFLSHALIKELRTLRGLYVMSHTASLLIFYIFLAISQINGNGLNATFCKICGFTVQFFFLAAFFWLNVMSADMWWSIKNLRPVNRGKSTKIKKELKKFFFCCCYAWGGPGIILCISLIMDLHPGIPNQFPKPDVGKTMCLIDADYNKLSALYYLYGPMGIIIISNLFFFISTAINIALMKKKIRILKGSESCCWNKEESKQFVVHLKLFVVMGITWLLEFLSWAIGGPSYIWYIPDFSNSLQGLYIFMIFFPKIKKEISKKFCQDQSRQNSKSTKNSSIGRSSKSSGSTSSSNGNKINGDIKLISMKCNNNEIRTITNTNSTSTSGSLLNAILNEAGETGYEFFVGQKTNRTKHL